MAQSFHVLIQPQNSTRSWGGPSVIRAAAACGSPSDPPLPESPSSSIDIGVRARPQWPSRIEHRSTSKRGRPAAWGIFSRLADETSSIPVLPTRASESLPHRFGEERKCSFHKRKLSYKSGRAFSSIWSSLAGGQAARRHTYSHYVNLTLTRYLGIPNA